MTIKLSSANIPNPPSQLPGCRCSTPLTSPRVSAPAGSLRRRSYMRTAPPPIPNGAVLRGLDPHHKSKEERERVCVCVCESPPPHELIRTTSSPSSPRRKKAAASLPAAEIRIHYPGNGNGNGRREHGVLTRVCDRHRDRSAVSGPRLPPVLSASSRCVGLSEFISTTAAGAGGSGCVVLVRGELGM